MFGKRLDDGSETYHHVELVRLAFPRRVYTQSHFDYAAEVILELAAKARTVRGVRIERAEQVPAPLHGGAGVGLTRADPARDSEAPADASHCSYGPRAASPVDVAAPRALHGAMPSTSLAFASAAEHRAWLEAQSALPAGFRIGTAGSPSPRSRRRSRRA